MLETVKKLCSLSGVSGDEWEVRSYIAERVGKYADSVTVDNMGNIIAFKCGAVHTEKRLMLCAHMDEVGLIITSITEGGYLRFACAGGIDRRVLPGRRVYIGKNKVPGIIGTKDIHLVEPQNKRRVPEISSLYIDVGANCADEAKNVAKVGDTAAFPPDEFELGEFELGSGFLKAKAIDDRVGCAVLLKLIELELPIDCYFVFTVQEEVGTRGAGPAAFAVRPDIALIVEGTTAADMPYVPDEKKICRPGAGVVIPFMDGGTIYNRGLFDLLKNIADENAIKWQTKTMIAGGTDASAVQRSISGVKTAGIACAIRNIHSPASVGNIDDFNGMFRLAKLFLERIGEKLQ